MACLHHTIKYCFTDFTFLKYGGNILSGGKIMVYHPKQFGIVLRNARMDKRLTQAELAEILDISLSYLKDLERFRNNPSYEVFEKVMHYFNLSADTVIYPNQHLGDDTCEQIKRLLNRCNQKQLHVILATTEALLSEHELPAE